MTSNTTPIDHCLTTTDQPLPWLHEYAAALEGHSMDEFRTDAGVITRSLESCVDLFGVAAVVPGFDTTMEAEAVGCPVSDTPGGQTIEDGCIESIDDAFDVDVDAILDHERIETVLDATDRLDTTVSGSSVLGPVTGPRQLTESLLSASDPTPDLLDEVAFLASDVQVALVNAYLERGADGIVVLESDGIEDSPRTADSFVPLSNVLDHYDATGLLLTDEVTEADIEAAGEYEFDAIAGQVDDPSRMLEVADAHDITLGVAVPDDCLDEDALEAYLASIPDDALVTSDGPVPDDVPPEVVHQFMGSTPE